MLGAPGHPYTRGLLASSPERTPRGERLPTIEGGVPSALERPSGCRFRDRCERAREVCAEAEPELAPFSSEAHRVACPVTAEERSA